ncbi:leucyl aminopeptidase [Thermoproteota archaeon]
MKINVKQHTSFKDHVDVIVLPLFQNGDVMSGIAKKADKKIGGRLTAMIKEKQLTGKKDETAVLYGTTALKAKMIICVGLGKKACFSYPVLRNSAGNVGRILTKLKTKRVLWALEGVLDNKRDPGYFGQALMEGMILGGYTFNSFKTEDEDTPVNQIKEIIIGDVRRKDFFKLKSGAERGIIIANAVNQARDLENTPSNFMTPLLFTEFAQNACAKTTIEIEIIDKKKAESLGMQAFLGVSKGSDEAPYILVLRYMPKPKQAPICLVGKGVTFDSGGISIKPSKGMEEMKGDMGGAAAVLSVVTALPMLGIKRNVCAIIPLVENMPSGKAQKPGDVVKAMNGKSIEIVNTDAEGRLILADALCYAVNQKPSVIIDIATLTGAVSVALGDVAAGILGNTQSMIKRFLKISQDTGDLLWQLPLYDDYLDYLKSDIADISNSSDKRLAGTANAAKFLEQFVDDLPWVHIDIAGVMHHTKDSGYTVKGMSGTGVRNILEFLLSAG